MSRPGHTASRQSPGRMECDGASPSTQILRACGRSPCPHQAANHRTPEVISPPLQLPLSFQAWHTLPGTPREEGGGRKKGRGWDLGAGNKRQGLLEPGGRKSCPSLCLAANPSIISLLLLEEEAEKTKEVDSFVQDPRANLQPARSLGIVNRGTPRAGDWRGRSPSVEIAVPWGSEWPQTFQKLLGP